MQGKSSSGRHLPNLVQWNIDGLLDLAGGLIPLSGRQYILLHSYIKLDLEKYEKTNNTDINLNQSSKVDKQTNLK